MTQTQTHLLQTGVGYHNRRGIVPIPRALRPEQVPLELIGKLLRCHFSLDGERGYNERENNNSKRNDNEPNCVVQQISCHGRWKE